MVLQPHNSKLSTELLQDFQIFSTSKIKLQPNSITRTYKVFAKEKDKSNKFPIQISIREKHNNQLHNHSTKHKTIPRAHWL